MHKISSRTIYFFGALGGLLFGYDTGGISGAILFIKQQMGLSTWEQSWIVSAVLIGAVLGAAIIGPMSDRFGRKRLLLLSAGIFFLGAVGSGLSQSFMVLITARVILGLSVGASSALIPTYLAELAPAEERGAVGTMFQLMIMTGIFLAYVMNWALSYDATNGWRWMLALAAVPAVFLFFGGILLPESPRFLVRNNRLADAQFVIGMTNNSEEAVKAEIEAIQSRAKEESQGGFAGLFGKMARPVLIMAIGLALFQQFMGCNTMLYFAPSIFTDLGFGVNATLEANIGIGIFNVVVTYFAMKIMDKIDRKKLLMIGSWGMGISLVLMSIGMHLKSIGSLGAIIAALSLIVYIAFFSATWGPIMWVMIGEAFPLSIRGLGNSFGAVINWIGN